MSTYTDTILVRIYLEGVLFPYAKSVVVSQSEGNVSCQIEVPPSIALKSEGWAGMTCHIFFANKRVLEKWGDSPPELLGWIDQKEAIKDENKGWPILFQGELGGESASVTVQSENKILNFVGHSRHYEQTIQFFTDPKNWTFDTQQQAYVVGNTTIEIELDGVLSRASQLLYTLHDRINSFSDDASDIAITSTVMQILRNAEKNHAIFGHFNNKIKLNSRFGVYPDPDIKAILALKSMASLIDKRAQALPSYTSLMKILAVATDILHYNWNHIAQPQLRTISIDAVNSAIAGDFEGSVEQGAEDSDDAAKMKKSTEQFIAKFRGKTTTFDLDVGTVTIPINFYEKAQKIDRDVFANRALKESRGFGVSGALELGFQKVLDLGFRPSGIPLNRKDPLENGQSKLPEITEEEAESAFKANSESGEDSKKKKGVIEMTELEQADLSDKDILTEFIITPRMHYAQPPRCNVILPYSFSNYGITRDHLREPTRLYGRVPLMPSTNGGQPAIIWYIAPASQAFHHLKGSQLSKFDPQYSKFMSENMSRYERKTDSTSGAAGTSEEQNQSVLPEETSG